MKLVTKKFIFLSLLFFLIIGGCLGYSSYTEHAFQEFFKSKGILVKTITYRPLRKEILFEGLSLTNTIAGYQLFIDKGMVSGVGLAEIQLIKGQQCVPIKKVLCNSVSVTYTGQNGPITTTAQKIEAESVVLYSTESDKKYNKEVKTGASSFSQELSFFCSSSIGELTFESLAISKQSMDTSFFSAGEEGILLGKKKKQPLIALDKYKEGQSTLLCVESATIKRMRYVDAFPFFGVGYDSARLLGVSENIVHLSAPLIQSSFSIKGDEVSFSLLAQDFVLPALLYSQISEDMHTLAQSNSDEPLICSFNTFIKSNGDKKHVTIEKSLSSEGLFDYSRTESLYLPLTVDTFRIDNGIFSFLSQAFLEEMDETMTDDGLFTAIATALNNGRSDAQSIEKIKNKKAEAYKNLALHEKNTDIASCYFALSSLWKSSGQLTLSFIPQKPTPAPVGFGFSLFLPPERGMSASYTQLSNE